MTKYEKLIEYIINDQEDQARQLFHQIVVEKSREIYESLVDETMIDNPMGSLVDEVTQDHTGIPEAEDDMDADMDQIGTDLDAMDADMDDMDADVGDAEADMDGMGMDGDGEELEDRVMDLEDALDELKAEFDALMAGDEQDEEDMDMDMDSEEDAEDAEDVEDADDEEEDDEDLQEAAMKKDDKKKKLMDADKKKVSEAARLREYVDKLGDIYSQAPAQGEGHEVGAGKKVKVDKDSTATGPGVNMGGTVVKAKGSEENPDGKATPTPNNEYTKGKGNLPHAGKFKNVPGGDAGKSSFKTKEGEYSSEHGAEGRTTGSTEKVSTHSVLKAR